MSFARTLSPSILTIEPSPSLSREGDTLRKNLDEICSRFLDSFSLGKSKTELFRKLGEVFREYGEAGWDGYSAAPASLDSYYKAAHFVQQFPSALPMPEVAVDPDGEMSFDWYVSSDENLTISFSPKDEITYAGVFGPNRAKGIEVFVDSIPVIILENLKRLYRLPQWNP